MEPAAPPEARAEAPETLTEAPEPVEPAQQESELRFWLRPLVMSVLVVVLLLLTLWDSRRVPTQPAPPAVQFATPAAGATVSTTDPALLDALTRLRQALSRRDARALANLADPNGVIVAGFAGTLPETGGALESDAFRLAQTVLPGANLAVLGWRTDPRGQVIVLTNGWQRRPLRLASNNTLELTSLAAVGLGQRAGVWYWRWLLPDPNGTLAQQAGSAGWQPLDARN